MKKAITTLTIFALLLSAASCGGSSTVPSATRAADDSHPIAESPTNGGSFAAGESPEADAAEAPKAPEYDGSFVTTAAGMSPSEGRFEAAGDSAEYGDYSESVYDASDSCESYIPEQNNARAGLLTAGEWRDNNNWPLWNSILTQRYEWMNAKRTWGLETLNRYKVCVMSGDTPYCGATVKLCKGKNVIWTAVSDSRGAAFLFDTKEELPDRIIVEAGGSSGEHEISPEMTEGEIKIKVDANPVSKKKLDLMFLIDTTGSMGDELSYIQEELQDVINKVVDSNQIDVRLSVNFYRDIGDDYVVKNYDFTDNIGQAVADLKAQRADGGGDYPEALANAMEKAVFNHSWGRTDESEKLMFLVLDAPSHQKDADMFPQILSGAAKQGIRIIPVASSGVDTDTEFLCRSFAITTGGTYTFLTDDSGIGNSHLEPTTGSYTVEKLNEMMIRIIGEYFSSEPYSAVSGNTSGKIEDVRQSYVNEYKLRCDYFQNSDYFGGEGYYGQVVISSWDELYGFYDDYGYKGEISYFAENIDFASSNLVIEVLCLSSGSVHINHSGLEAYYRNGEIEFKYELTRPETATCDMSAIYLMAEAPKN